ncbi:hypothetical protein [Desulfolutivibrio sulfoxidireducens]|uniref:hypothetical protein n=1 Tax=Desulfolutivibrio sulfoxidireducens TaxID=2773299 RepID=UPI00159D9700|nr:hypothetical protein [Desulfolutivibrio sulfoxidireducens]QLA17543.1 hypothetical protein GD605_16380 [Desulfolutivibrio sulfoxidireducens]
MISKSCLLCGLLYIVIFLPLTIYSSEIQGLNPLAIILFSRVPDALVENFRTNFFPIVTIRGASPFVYACGLAYGVNGLGVYLVSKLSSPTIKIKSGLTAKGIFGGYFISLIIIDFFSKSVDFWTYNGRLFFLRISYVIFFFFLIELTKDRLPQKWFVKSKYDFFFDGLYGIISTYIIGYGFAEEVSFIITGPLFIFCALITSYSENFIIGFFADIVVNFIKIEERLNTMLCNMDRTFPSRTIADIQKSQKLSFWSCPR